MKNITGIFIVLLAIVVLCSVAYTQQNEYISEKAMSQGALFRYLQRVREQDANRVISYAAITPTGTAVHLGKDLNYLVDGIMYQVAATTTSGIAAAAQTGYTKCQYLLSVGTDGVITTTKGTDVAVTATPVIPDTPAGKIPFANILVQTATDAFTLGTTNVSVLTSIGVTHYSVRDHTADSNYENL